MKLVRHHPLSRNDLRQCLRTATGATIAFALCKYFNWQNGVFYTVTPVLLLGIIPQINKSLALQIIASSVMCGLELGLLYGMLGDKPMLIIPVICGLFYYRFRAMSIGRLFLFGSSGVLNFSIMLNFASYPSTDIFQLIGDNVYSSVLAVIIAYLMHMVWPDVDPRAAPPAVDKSPQRIRHETMLGTGMAVMCFLIFQTFDLQDSISAQATVVLMLFPMHWNGMMSYARKRAIGTLFGVSFGIMVQFILYDWSNLLILVIPCLWIGLLLFSQVHVTEARGSGVGFGCMTTLGILFGQYLTPTNDIWFSALYRLSSIGIAIVMTMFVATFLHKLLNQFESTRFGH